MQGTCAESKKISPYTLGELSEDRAADLEQHLSECPDCTSALSELEARPDDFVALLRESAGLKPAAALDEPEFRSAVERIVTQEFANRPSTPIANDATQARQGGSPDQLAERTALGQYDLLQPIGRGGMGVVYKAHHRKLNRTVALKALSSSATDNAMMLDRFDREMQAVGRLDHPNIVRASDAGEIDGVHFLVMDFVDGPNLSQLLKQAGPLSVADASELVRQAAVGLQNVHEHGLVHRDLKPGNLMLTADGTIKILDLGLARLHGNPLAAGDLTATGQLMGTIDYMSPEQAENTRDADIRADIYSLGATLFALLTGHAPFAADRHSSMMQRLVALATQMPERLDVLRDDVPTELADLVEQLLVKQPEERPGMPQEIANALAPFATEHNTAALYENFSSTAAAAEPIPEATRSSLSAGSALVVTQVSAPVGQASSFSGKQSTDAARGVDRLETYLTLATRRKKWLLVGIVVALVLFFYGGQITRIAAGKGLLVIKASDAPIQVTVLQGSGDKVATVVDQDSGREYSLGMSDDYRVIVTDANLGIELRSEKVTIARGGTTVVEVISQTDAWPVSESSEGPAIDAPKFQSPRDIAEWVIAQGGTVAAGNGDVWSNHISTLADMPDGNLWLGAVHFPKGTTISPEELKRCVQLRSIEQVGIPFHERLLPAHLDSLHERPELSILTLGTVKPSPIDDDDIATLLGKTPKIVCVQLFALNLNGTCLDGVNATELLRTLKIGSPNFHVTDRQIPRLSIEFLQSLRRFPNLNSVGLARVALKREHFAALQQLPALEQLNVQGASGIAESIDLFTRMPHLQELNIAGSELRDEDLLELAKCVQLRHLDINKCPVSREAVDKLRLTLPQCKIKSNFGTTEPHATTTESNNDSQGQAMKSSSEQSTRKTLGAIKFESPREVAEWVLAQGGSVSVGANDEDGWINVADVADLPDEILKLYQIVLPKATTISPAELRQVVSSPDLEAIYLCQHQQLHVQHIHAISNCQGLQTLDFGTIEPADISDQDFRELFQRLPQLRRIQLFSIGLTGTCLDGLLHPERIEILQLGSRSHTVSQRQIGEVSVDCLRKMRRMTKLTKLQIPRVALTREHFLAMQQLPALESLHIFGATGIPESIDLFAGMPHLQELNISDAKLTDEQLLELANCSQLNSLNIVNCPVSPEAVEKLHQLLPSCRIVSDFGTFE